MPHLILVHNDSNYFLRHRLPVVDELCRLGIKVHVMAGGERIIPPEGAAWTFEHFDIERFRFGFGKDVFLAGRLVFNIVRLRPASVFYITLKPVLYGGLIGLIMRGLTGYPDRLLMLLPGLGRFMSPAPEPERRRPARRITEACLRWISKQKNVHFAFETDHDRSYLDEINVLHRQKSSVVRGAGVDPTIYFPAKRESQKTNLRILFASRLMASKGLNTFLAAARHFRDYESIQFLVAGIPDEQDPDRIEPASLATLPEITFLGQVREMPDLIRSCDVVCLPTSYGEGIPRILIEAAACGIATIASDLPGCREITLDRVSGIILTGKTEEERSVSLVEAIHRYHDEPGLEARHGLAAIRHFYDGGFSVPNITRQFVDMLGFTGQGK